MSKAHGSSVSRRVLYAVGAVIIWICLWYLVPNLHSYSIFQTVTDDRVLRITLESVLAVVLFGVLCVALPRLTQKTFSDSWRVRRWYTLPLVLAAALPFHYTMELPLWLYLLFITVSVFWQNYITFGLL